MKSVLDMTNVEARDFLLSPERYCSFDLPTYIELETVLKTTDTKISSTNPYRSGNPKVGDVDNVNHLLLTNKDGSYAWRPFQIVHPVLYTELVNALTEEANWKALVKRFSDFQANDNILCASIPVQEQKSKSPKESSILNWWLNIEQASIRLSLDYKYLTTTDITDCYGALYTHSVAWAIHTKPFAKANRRDTGLLGNAIDGLLQDMQGRQTNGIPQGNVVSDLIAEIVLGYADELLSDEIKAKNIKDYKILRYRDDYRIFTQTAEDGKAILLLLTKVLAELNFKLNSSKTHITDNVVTGSIKPDKLYWYSAVKYDKSLLKTLLIIRKLANNYPNSGSLAVALGDFRKRIEKQTKKPKNNDVLIPVVVDIMYNNPRIYPTAASILSKLLSFENEQTTKGYITQIIKKFEDIPNIGFLDIWLQRISIKYDRTLVYGEKLSQIVAGGTEKLWNSDWLVPDVKQAIEGINIISEDEIAKIDKIIPLAETESFLFDYFEPTDDKESRDE
jgi:RNA-directed DNA polymerase